MVEVGRRNVALAVFRAGGRRKRERRGRRKRRIRKTRRRRKRKTRRTKRKTRKRRGGEGAPSLNTLYSFIEELKNSDEEEPSFIQEKIDAIKNEASTIEYYMKQSKESWAKGKYYIINLRVGTDEPLTDQLIKDALKKSFNCGATNSCEHQSMMQSLSHAHALQRIVNDYDEVMNHLKYKPGSEGMRKAEERWEAQVELEEDDKKKPAGVKEEDTTLGGGKRRIKKTRRRRKKRC